MTAATGDVVEGLGPTARVYQALRADILAGRIAPGSRLGFAALVERYDCSIGAIREALQRLGEQELVIAEPKRGFRVVDISPDDLNDLTEARCEIEVLALRYAVNRGNLEWESTVVAAHHRMERTPMFAPTDPDRFNDEWVLAHAEFHQALLDGCSNRRILATASALRDSAELYRQWSAPQHDRKRDIAAEHRAILDAAVGRDAELACELLTAHIQRTTDALLSQPQ
ncbi:GntR family transcriptional regulator [Mycolicibacterium goodii]|uniref:GntR family transcriptional regulator n=1 Tax=Mycolicibacterium goodii TaxID=134601 RepID=UPI000C262E7C|nr:GntR family transcriptional regulator [Mycolicibacterium goodii]PJK20078.1 GntR family transcriptional regulator [Mycolicibacterium goodii]